MSFASKLQEIRQEYGISQEALAEMLSVSRQSVSKWERGKGYPEIDKLIYISEHFNVSLDDLLKERKSEKISSSSEKTRERRPISLTKPDSHETEEVQEIYPENRNFFNGTVVTENNNLARYENYSFSQQSQPQTQSQPHPVWQSRRRFRRRIVAVVGFSIAAVGFSISALTVLFSSNVHHGEQIYPEADGFDYYYDELFEYSLRFLIDSATGTRYVFEQGNDYGIVTSLDIVDLSSCTKLTNPVDGGTRYCEDSYINECAVISPEGSSLTYVIPVYMLSTFVPDENQNDYMRGQDSNSRRWFYVPAYIIDQCESVISSASENIMKSSEVSEISEVVYIENEEAEVNEAEENNIG